MNKVDLSQIKGAPAGYAGPPKRAYEADPNKKYYEDDRAGIEYQSYNGLNGLTKEAYDSRVQAKSRSDAFKKKISDGIAKREAERKAAAPEPNIADSAVINVDDKTVDATMNKVEKVSKPPSSPAAPAPVADDYSLDDMKSISSFSARDINQNVGKKGDMNTTITNSEIGEQANIGNDVSSTEGIVNAGNTSYKPAPLKNVGGGNPFSESSLFSARDIDQNVGKQGDMNTTITDSTVGDRVSIGNDFSSTVGDVNAGNRFTAKRRAQQYGFSGSGELTFS